MAAAGTDGGAPRVGPDQTERFRVALLALGLDVARVEIEGPDPPPAELHGQQRGEPVEGGLGGGVAEPPSALADRTRRVGGGDVRGDVHDRAPAPLEHAGKDDLDQDELGDHVGGQLGLQLLDGQLQHRDHAARAGVDRIVDQQVDAAPGVDDPVEGRSQSGVVVEVGHQLERLATRPAHQGGRLLQAAGDGASRSGVGMVATLPRPRVRPVTATSHPGSASASAVALPMPRVAPVTTARRWSGPVASPVYQTSGSPRSAGTPPDCSRPGPPGRTKFCCRRGERTAGPGRQDLARSAPRAPTRRRTGRAGPSAAVSSGPSALATPLSARSSPRSGPARTLTRD